MPEQLSELTETIYSFIDQQILPVLAWPTLQMTFDWYAAQMQAERRPHYGELLPMLTCAASGGNAADAEPLAAAWIFYNLASDLFDDLVDQDGKERPWMAWEADQAMRVGLGLIAAAQYCLARVRASQEAKDAIQEAYAATLAIAAREQGYGGNVPDSERPDVSAYLRHILGKTGLVLATVAWSGARVHSQDETVLEAMHDFGLAIGVMVQLLDDLRDLQNGDTRSDLTINPHTLPVLYGLSLTDHPCRSRLCSLLRSDLRKPTTIIEVCDLLAEMGAVSYTLSVVRAYEEKAHDALRVLPVENRIHLSDYASSFLRQIPAHQ